MTSCQRCVALCGLAAGALGCATGRPAESRVHETACHWPERTAIVWTTEDVPALPENLVPYVDAGLERRPVTDRIERDLLLAQVARDLPLLARYADARPVSHRALVTYTIPGTVGLVTEYQRNPFGPGWHHCGIAAHPSGRRYGWRVGNCFCGDWIEALTEARHQFVELHRRPLPRGRETPEPPLARPVPPLNLTPPMTPWEDDE